MEVIMQINIEKNYIELTPERSDERAKLETIWKMMVDCVRFNKKLVPMGEYIPPEKNIARFAIEGEKGPGAEDYPDVRVDKDCRCYCQTCNKYVELKKGDRIPPCCGKLMEIMD
jgi:hypothetical protein